MYAYADYTLRYDANAGGEKVENMPLRERSRACRDSVEMKISDKRPERMGYDFLGWAEEETAVLSEYRPGDPVAINRKRSCMRYGRKWCRAQVRLS